MRRKRFRVPFTRAFEGRGGEYSGRKVRECWSAELTVLNGPLKSRPHPFFFLLFPFLVSCFFVCLFVFFFFFTRL